MHEHIDYDEPDDYYTEDEVRQIEWQHNKDMRLAAGPGYYHSSPFYHHDNTPNSDDLPW